MALRAESIALIEDAVYWQASGMDDDANATILAPVAIKTKWDYEVRDTLNPLSGVRVSSISAQVDRDIPIGSILWKGNIVDLDANSELYEVISLTKVCGVKRYLTIREVSLIRYHKTLPELAS